MTTASSSRRPGTGANKIVSESGRLAAQDRECGKTIRSAT
jgi:hypothetical protein